MGSSKMVMMFVFLLILERCLSREGCLEHERSALLQIKNILFHDPHIYLQNWVDDENYSDCCQWERVKCNHTTGRVIQLHLSASRFWVLGEGYLNASLFTPFQQLESLDLSFSNIVGCVENEGLEKLSSLRNLKFLDLSGNPFINSSILSFLTRLSSLRTLSLCDNRLEGNIDVKAFSNLESLDLSRNKLNRSILSSLTSLSSLRKLYLLDIGLNGTFNIQELDSWSNLEELHMSSNEIDNILFPKDYKGLRKLNTLYLDEVNIKDGSKLLRSMESFPSLKTLSIASNNFTGTVTTTQELKNFTNLEELRLDHSTLHKSLIQSVAAFTSLKRLSMGDCELINGVLPRDQGNLNFKNLEYLNMYGTTFKSDYLQISKSMVSLKNLSLSFCSLNGTILDQGLCELVHLEELHIDNNNLRGSLPWCLANMTSLRILDIFNNNLSGNVSLSPLTHLTSIEELRLFNNHFQIPISLEPFLNLSTLKFFNGGSNEIYAETESHSSLTPKFQLSTFLMSGYGDGGTFPKFLYHQHELVYVDLSHLNLTGKFPNWLLENNTKLETLLLANNSLSESFRMPNHSHKQLTKLDVSNNFFQGHIPKEIGAYMSSLRDLNFSGNAFNGSIPPSFGDMNLLQSLDISYNQLTGEIPEHMATGCLSLLVLALSNNSLQGHIFSKNFNLTALVRLQLDGNKFIGEIPESLSNCFFLAGLYLSDNQLSGKIPKWLGNFSSLEDIMVPNNYIEGSIPMEFCQLDSLKILDLSNNSISGSLPSCFSPSSIQQVHLSNNKIEGHLEDVFHHSPNLQTLDLSYNLLRGSVPNWIGGLSQLSYLLLANNYIEGELPVQLCRLKELRLIDLSQNNLSGHIPPCLVNTSLSKGYYDVAALTSSFWDLAPSSAFALSTPPPSVPTVYNRGPSLGKAQTLLFRTKNMAYYYKGRILTSMSGIDLSCNQLTGEIPTQIGYLTRIRALNLSHNNLMGTIPTTFSNLKQIESLDLSYNLLHGKIPQLIELNALAVFSVAYNNLSGKIPDRVAQFSTFNEDSYEGHPFLCGLPLAKSCKNGSSPSLIPEVSIGNEEDDCLIDMDSFYITFTISYVIVILGIVGVLWVNPY